MAILAGAQPVEAQRATITPRSATAPEGETVEFTVGASWRYDAEVQYFTEDITATGTGNTNQSQEGDYLEFATDENWTYCHEGNDVGGQSPGCSFNHVDSSVVVRHLLDDHDGENTDEPDERYRLIAQVVRYETGRLTADGIPEVRECPNGCGRVTATGTITNFNQYEDPEPAQESTEWTITIEGGGTVTEGQSVTLTVRFQPTASPHGRASARWATEESGSDANHATSGSDYSRGSGTAQFTACSTTSCPEQTQQITIRTRTDNVRDEVDETFQVRLTSFTNANTERGNDWVPITIRDGTAVEASAPEVRMSGDVVIEGDTATVTISLSAPGPSGASVTYSIGEPDERARKTQTLDRGTRQDCRDFQYRTGTLSLGGRTSATLQVRTYQDACLEYIENVWVTLSSPRNVKLVHNGAEVVIEDLIPIFEIVHNEDLIVFEGQAARVTIERTAYH